jgi:hypothetical protein
MLYSFFDYVLGCSASHCWLMQLPVSVSLGLCREGSYLVLRDRPFQSMTPVCPSS